jgi:PadR family transcriptional regulator, regulatory protein PadR
MSWAADRPRTDSMIRMTALLTGSRPPAWRHGYALAKQTGLKSGALYPILIRLADRGLVEACWQEEPEPGRPRRHLYRLTVDGRAAAAARSRMWPSMMPGGARGCSRSRAVRLRGRCHERAGPRRPRCRGDGGGWPGGLVVCS